MRCKRILLLGFLLLVMPYRVFSADVSGVVKVVSVSTHPGWDGVMVQLAHSVVVDAQCGNNSWALLKVNSELDKAMVSLLIAAQTSQQSVRLFTDACAVPPDVIGAIPLIQTVDLGVRD